MIPREFVYERPDTIASENPNQIVANEQLQAIAGIKNDPIEFSSDIFDILANPTNPAAISVNDPTAVPPGVGDNIYMPSYFNNPFYNSLLNNNLNLTIGGSSSSPEIFIPSEAMNPTTTAGCGGLRRVEAGTNDVDYWVLDFDTTTEEHCFFTIRMPDDWNASTVTFQFVWTNASGSSSQTVVWGIKGRAYADSDAIDQAYGTEVTTTDTWLAQNDIHLSDESTAVTPAGSLAAGQWLQFKISRKTASDNMTGDAGLIGVRLKYVRV